MSLGILFPVDRSEPLVPMQFNELDDYYRVVGGYIEAVRVGQEGLAFLGHDEGKLIGSPINPRATLLWWLLTPEARGVDCINGPVVLIGPDGPNDTTEDVPEDIRKLMFPHATGASYVLDVKVAGSTKWHRNDSSFGDFFEAAQFAMDLVRLQPEVDDVRVTPIL